MGSFLSLVCKRARCEAQKSQRRSTLLEAAARLLATQPIDEISLNAIAREANVSKANVYRYFESREELFLHLALEAASAWSTSVIQRLDRLDRLGDEAGVARAFTETTVEHPVFARLVSVLSTVLERNVSVEVVARFKLQMLAGMGELIGAVHRALPDLSPPQVIELLRAAYFQLVALWPAGHPPPAVQEALKRPELADACVDFEQTLTRTIVLLVRGLRSDAPD
ncbi:MAG: TetR family transcriptional regulator [Myxococcota bacterium]